MFDIGFSEMLVIAVVALIVIGPERLPKVARTLGHLFGRMQRYVNDVKADISREMELDELRKLQTTIQDAAQSFEQSVKSEVSATESQFQKIAQEANPGVRSAASPPAAAETVAAIPPADPARVRYSRTGHVPAISRRPRCTRRVALTGECRIRQLAGRGEHCGQSHWLRRTCRAAHPAEARAQLSLDLTASQVPADKPA